MDGNARDRVVPCGYAGLRPLYRYQMNLGKLTKSRALDYAEGFIRGVGLWRNSTLRAPFTIARAKPATVTPAQEDDAVQTIVDVLYPIASELVSDLPADIAILTAGPQIGENANLLQLAYTASATAINAHTSHFVFAVTDVLLRFWSNLPTDPSTPDGAEERDYIIRSRTKLLRKFGDVTWWDVDDVETKWAPVLDKDAEMLENVQTLARMAAASADGDKSTVELTHDLLKGIYATLADKGKAPKDENFLLLFPKPTVANISCPELLFKPFATAPTTATGPSRPGTPPSLATALAADAGETRTIVKNNPDAFGARFSDYDYLITAVVRAIYALAKGLAGQVTVETHTYADEMDAVTTPELQGAAQDLKRLLAEDCNVGMTISRIRKWDAARGGNHNGGNHNGGNHNGGNHNNGGGHNGGYGNNSGGDHHANHANHGSDGYRGNGPKRHRGASNMPPAYPGRRNNGGY